MSTRRTRQELIEQGVLKEVPDNGKSASANACTTLSVSDSVGPKAVPPTYSRVKSSAHYGRNAILPNSSSLRPGLKQQPYFHLSASEMRFRFENDMPVSRAVEKWNKLCPAGK